MGQAEQRQVKSGVAGRLAAEAAAAKEADGRIAEIRRHRVELDDASRHVRGHQAGLRAAIALAILNPNPPTDERVARAAGWTVLQVEALRADLNP